MSMSVLPPGPEIMPLTRQNKGMLRYFAKIAEIPAISDALTGGIREHQEFVLTTHCECPAVLGGDPL